MERKTDLQQNNVKLGQVSEDRQKQQELHNSRQKITNKFYQRSMAKLCLI